MRKCRQCNKQDAPWFTDSPCSCGAPRDDNNPSPFQHSPDCNGIGHEVVLYRVRIGSHDLTFDQKLSPKWMQRGWSLWKNGIQFFRVKYLCRQCIVAEDIAQARRREYQKVCRETRGGEAMSYAQMLASQD